MALTQTYTHILLVPGPSLSGTKGKKSKICVIYIYSLSFPVNNFITTSALLYTFLDRYDGGVGKQGNEIKVGARYAWAAN